MSDGTNEGLIGIEDFGKLRLRTAKVTDCRPHPNAEKLLLLDVDLGAEQRRIVAGLAERYAPDDLVGKTIVVVANLKPAKLRGETSEGMLLAATAPDGTPTILTVDGELKPGAKIS
jgi:methionyl-tRNA synthetase